jgi:hypothetical protein
MLAHAFALSGDSSEAHVILNSWRGRNRGPSRLRLIGNLASSFRAAPFVRRRLAGEKLSYPTFGCDARPLGCNRVGGFIGEVLMTCQRMAGSESRSHLRCAGRGVRNPVAILFGYSTWGVGVEPRFELRSQLPALRVAKNTSGPMVGKQENGFLAVCRYPASYGPSDHPHNCQRRIIGLVFFGEVVHRVEDQVNEICDTSRTLRSPNGCF